MHGLDLVIIDKLRLLNDYKSHNSDISHGLRQIALEYNVPMVITANINRALENRRDKRPRLADLIAPDDLENIADLVLFLYREEVYMASEANKGIASLIVERNKYGPIGSMSLQFDKSTTIFKDIEWDQ